MFERICDCLVHPSHIGKHFGDKARYVILTIILFIFVYLGVLATKCYLEPAFDDSSYSIITGEIISKNISGYSFNDETDTLEWTGQDGEFVNGRIVEGSGYKIVLLPQSKVDWKSFAYQSIYIVLYAQRAEVYYYQRQFGSFEYKDSRASGFTFEGIIRNEVNDIYNFKFFIEDVLDSSEIRFQTFYLGQSFFDFLAYYFIIVAILVLVTQLFNPTIDFKVRFKLCCYDTIIYIFVSMLAFLFNFEWLMYLAITLPFVYGLITFRHIIKIPLK